MFSDQSDEPADSRIVQGFSLADLHPDSIRQFRNRFASRTPDHPWLRDDDQALLTRLGALRVDRARSITGITIAGLLMFGKSDAITAPEAVPGFHVDFRERFSDDPAIRWTDRLTSDGTWEANVFQFYQQTIVRLSTGPGVRRPFQRDPEGYRRQVTPVHEALQEALVNALIHADYSGQGGIVIDRYPDRIEFSNPGTLLVSREQLLAGGVSECRNKSLQRMFQMLGVGDKAGSGIDKIRSSWESQHWQSPRLKEIRRPDRVQLLLPMVSTLPTEAMQDLRRRFGAKLEACGPDELQALVTAATEGDVTNQRLQEMLAVHRADITKLLRGLVRRGFLTSDGVGRGTRYSVAREPVLGDSGSGSPSEDPSSPDKDRSSPDKDRSSPDKDPSSPDKDPSSPDKDPLLLEIASGIRTLKRANPTAVRAAIAALCRDRYLTLRELASLLGRKPETLRDGYLAGMVSQGDLQLRYPDRPNHPDQGYRTRSSDGQPE